jgi:hypothetical protein
LSWAAYSPDCNHIEHAWDSLDRAVRSHDVQPSNLDQLATGLQEELRNIGQQFPRILFFHFDEKIGKLQL